MKEFINLLPTVETATSTSTLHTTQGAVMHRHLTDSQSIISDYFMFNYNHIPDNKRTLNVRHLDVKLLNFKLLLKLR